MVFKHQYGSRSVIADDILQLLGDSPLVEVPEGTQVHDSAEESWFWVIGPDGKEYGILVRQRAVEGGLPL